MIHRKIDESENEIVSWVLMQRFVPEGNKQDKNSTLILVERTRRKDPLDNFKYTGGWNISAKHDLYLSLFLDPFVPMYDFIRWIQSHYCQLLSRKAPQV